MAIDARKELTLAYFFRTLHSKGMLLFVCGLRGANSLDEIYCPDCHRLLAENSQYCIDCGNVFAGSDANPQNMRAGQKVSASAGGRKPTRPLADQDIAIPSGSRKKTRPLADQEVQRHTQLGRINSSLLDKDYEDDGLDFTIEEEITSVAEPRHETWLKVVEAPDRPPVVHPPRPAFPPQSRSILRHTPYGRPHVSPVLLFWCSMIVIFFFVGGGVFGIVGTLGRGHIASAAGATLQVTPNDVAMGATMNLRGFGFSPHAQVGFTRDAAIPVVDTNGATIITTDGDGNFTDTMVVGSDWVNGAHTISAEDAVTHKLISSPIQVTGMGDLLRPAHLELSTNTLDLGAGDQATNSVQKVVLTNLGGGQISWEAAATQSWLTISPQQGTFSSGMKAVVVIAANRANLPSGNFADQVLFSSSAGSTVLPVKMSVTALQPQGEAVLQIAPATLFFTSNDGGPAPTDQTVAINNPGQLSLNWTAATNVPWLTVSSQTGTVFASSSGSAVVHVDTRKLLPGTYNGTVTFNGNGTTVDSPQNIAVSVTVMPGCTLAVAPNMLTFTAGYLQSAPDPKMIDLNSSHCSSSLAWSASSNTSWLTVGQTSGSTPANPSIMVNPAGLKSGTYTGSVTFSSDSGQQQVPVKFIIGQPAVAVLSVSSTDDLNFSGVIGQNDTRTKHITLANTGSGTLSWRAKVTTGNDGDWLSVNPGSGEISAHQSISLHVNAQMLANMVPDTYSGTITITGTDQQGNMVTGSPQSISVNEVVRQSTSPTPTITPAPTAAPSVTVSNTTLSFSTHVGNNPASQTVTITNTGSDSLHWEASTPSQSWLSVSPSHGNNGAGISSTITVSVDATGLAPHRYHAMVVVTPSNGSPITIEASLKVDRVPQKVQPSPTPIATPRPTPFPTPTATPQPSPTSLPTPTPDATESPPTPVPTVASVPPPPKTVTPSPEPQPTATPKIFKQKRKHTQEASTTTVDVRSVPLPTLPPTVVPTQKVVVQPTPDSIPTPTPKPKIRPTPTPKPKIRPTPTPKPKIIPTPTPKPEIIPTPTPKPEIIPTPNPSSHHKVHTKLP